MPASLRHGRVHLRAGRAHAQVTQSLGRVKEQPNLCRFIAEPIQVLGAAVDPKGLNDHPATRYTAAAKPFQLPDGTDVYALLSKSKGGSASGKGKNFKKSEWIQELGPISSS